MGGLVEEEHERLGGGGARAVEDEDVPVARIVLVAQREVVCVVVGELEVGGAGAAGEVWLVVV